MSNALIYVQTPVGYKSGYLSLETVVDAVCAHFDVPIAALKGTNRKKSIVDARHTVCYLACLFTRLSLNDIGSYLGGRDHTTVIHGRDKIRDMISTRDPITHDVLILQQQLEKETRRFRSAA